MFKVSNTSEVMQLIANYKKNNEAKKIETNFFGFKSDSVTVAIIESNKGVFFIEKNPLKSIDTYYYYSALDEVDSIRFLLPTSTEVKCEYLFSGEANKLVLSHLLNVGFEKYAALEKMYRLNNQVDYSLDGKIKACTLKDLDYLRDVFDSYFDKISERPPANDEILNAIKSQSVFKITDGSKVLGFYWADFKRFVSELRYIFIDQSARGRKQGEILFTHYLASSKNVKKNQLWVLKDNIAAINLYKKYGFINDTQQDYIFKVKK